MLPAHQRMAEIFLENLKGRLTDELGIELQHCLKVNADYCLDMNFLNTQLIQARITKDVKWEAHITAQMDWLRRTGKVAIL
ncbi:hypothetical protein [Paenibacillus sp. P32E]|uniref:DUF7667 family protein n=1 Tax=Paenibacillus sp. P32E TaxID=1349434 RepID=UPI00093900FA|nr:hypothetical protein [Paenibacillus sp. P32E]OKP91359.1 hypothetical protein A3848_09640 [Paenibacillus sp. P32E]